MFGYSISKGSLSDISIGSGPEVFRELTASTTMTSIYTGSAAIVTFYVEPVKLTYGHQARNAQSETQVVDINIPSNQRILSNFNSKNDDLKPLEFPEFYDEEKGRCFIPLYPTAQNSFDSKNPDPLESLYKWAWPGYILEDYYVYKTKEGKIVNESNKPVIMADKEYDENTTTILEDPERRIVNEYIPSYFRQGDKYYTYVTDKGNDTPGFASDKHFTYIYNTPTLEIEHKYYKTNDYMQADSHKLNNTEQASKDIKYTTQIVNQFAYIDSLVTDNVKDKYTMSIRNANEQVESFTYKYPRYDLVAVRISEKKGNSYVHYATLYEEDTYRDKMVKDSRYESDKNVYYKVKDYEGVFGKYYSDSLNSIAMQIKEELATRRGVSKDEKEKLMQVFNTNKNWKVEFIYDEVDRVYIKFKDLKGNNIFVKSGDSYIGEITSKLPESPNEYEREITNLGTNDKFLLVKYTSGDTNYTDDLSKAEDVSAPHWVRESAGDGDKYYIFYYLTGNTIKIEYRDKDDNKIKDPITTEIPSTGTIVDIPKIELYELLGYKHDSDYNLTDPGISGDIISLTPEDKEISIPNPYETDHHVIIYYQPKETLKVEYRDIHENPIIVPPQYVSGDIIEIPEEGTTVTIPEVPGYKYQNYKHNDNYNGIDNIITTAPKGTGIEEGANIPVVSNGKNQYIIIYYNNEMTDPIDLTIKFVPEDPDAPDGKPDMDDPLRNPVTIEIPKDVDVPVPVPDIDEYTPISYIEGEPPIDPIPKPDPLVGEPIVSGDGPIEVILIYRPENEDPGTPGPQDPIIITPEDNMEKAFLQANNFGSEEYKVEVAIPTSEDLYVSGDVYSYRFTTKMPESGDEVNVKVQVFQKYYTNLDDTSKETLGETSTDILTIPISYSFYDIQEAYLYDLKSLKLENGAIKYYDNYQYNSATDIVEHGYSETEANFKLKPKPEPKIVYEPVIEGVAAVGKNEESNVRVQITSGNGYTVKYEDGIFKIYIDDIDYYDYEELAGENSLKEQLELEAQAIIEKCTQIKIEKLYIQMDGADDVEILTGKKYHLPEKSEALKSTDFYMPYVAGRTPLYSFLEDKDLYVMEKAQNRLYNSTLVGNYRLIDAIKNNVHLDTDEKLKNAFLYDDPLTVEKITVNPLNIHTPIIKDVTLTPNDDKTQLENVPSTVDYVLNLEETFDITIKNLGMHLDQKGYGERNYNNLGLLTGTEEKDHTLKLYEPTVEGRKTIKQKSADEIMPLGSFANRKSMAGEERDEELAKGPSFAEYKLIKFPYDVYLTKTDANSPTTGKPQLFKANEWYNLNEYVKPSVETYTFALPTWVKDATAYMDEEGKGIYVLVVAENCLIKSGDEDILDKALADPMSVSEATTNTLNKDKTYILRQSYSTYVSGRLYDLQIRDTDDPGYMNKIKPALEGSTEAEPCAKEMPIAQSGQVPAYKMGLKLGYRFYFDLKTKGVSNKDITITPNIYWVSKDGTQIRNVKATDQNQKISLFYHTKGTLYNKLTEKDLSIRMTMAGTHGMINNPGYTQETIAASQLATSQLATRDFRSQIVIGKIVNGLNLIREKVKLPYDNIVEIGKACGYTGTDEQIEVDLLSSALNNAKTEETLLENENMIKNATGHWYGEYYLPATTYVYAGEVQRENVINGSAKSAELKDGYLVVVFEKITTEDDVAGDEDTISPNYLTYAAPSTESQWIKEGVDTAFTLPNGVNVAITQPGTTNLIEAGAMAIYQVGLRANNDFEIEGTH